MQRRAHAQLELQQGAMSGRQGGCGIHTGDWLAASACSTTVGLAGLRSGDGWWHRGGLRQQQGGPPSPGLSGVAVLHDLRGQQRPVLPKVQAQGFLAA